MNNKELQKSLAKKLGFTQAEVGENLTVLVRCIEQSLLNGDNVSITRLGSLEAKTRSSRTAKMPNATECITIPERTDVVLKVTNTFKDHLKENK